MKTILFPTDFSDAANHAFVYALQLAYALEAKIVTIHAYELPDLRRANLSRMLAEVYESIKLEEFEDYRDSIPVLHKIAEEQGMTSVEVQHVLQEGNPTRAIFKQAHKEEADLIVLGTTGATGLKEVFLGSVAGEVMEKAPCPVLAVPQSAVFDGNLDKLAFATDYNREDPKAIRWFADLAKVIGAKIEVVHIDLGPADTLNTKMTELASKVADQEDFINFSVVGGFIFEEALTNYLGAEKIDILATLIHKRNMIQEFFSYSLTKKLAYHLTTPILAMPAKVFGD
ncbi:MAG: universal stress protein [Bacteroidota bacterium]